MALVRYLCGDALSRGQEQLRALLQGLNHNLATPIVSAGWFGEAGVVAALQQHWTLDDLAVCSDACGWQVGECGVDSCLSIWQLERMWGRQLSRSKPAEWTRCPAAAGFHIWNNLSSRNFKDLLRVVLADALRLWEDKQRQAQEAAEGSGGGTAAGAGGQLWRREELEVRHPLKPNEYYKGELLEEACAALQGLRLVGGSVRR